MLFINNNIITIKSFFSELIKTSKKTVKKHKYSNNLIVKTNILMLYVLRNIVKLLIRICTDSDFRSIIFSLSLNSKNLHQTTSITFMNRYPYIFSACRDYFNGKQDLKILSFGCSTGEEVLTLRNYFPTAHIVGAEINKHSLKICRTLPVDDKITFVYSKPVEIQKYGQYDAIFCMAVLQREPHVIAAKGISSLKKTYPFEKFEQKIIELDELLYPQGLMVIHYTQYSLLDTTVASKYKTLGNYNQDDYISPVFDINSTIIKNPTSQNTIFIKNKLISD